MGWSIGYDENWKRDIGYGVPAVCDHPDCSTEIDRGLSYVCCGQQPHGGDYGCGLFFCSLHRGSHYTDNHANAILGELVESLVLAGHSVDQAIESQQVRFPLMCQRCATGAMPFEAKPDTYSWFMHKETHDSWAEWREERDQIRNSGLESERRSLPMSDRLRSSRRRCEFDVIEQPATYKGPALCYCEHCTATFEMSKAIHNLLCKDCYPIWKGFQQ